MQGIENMLNKQTNEYYFDRDQRAFAGILTYMQTGVLDKPDSVPYQVYLKLSNIYITLDEPNIILR